MYSTTWSILIPAYRCNPYLPACIRSVLSQDPGPESLQIAVVNDDPADFACANVVAACGGSRIEYHYNPKNLGAGGNFNRCIALARHDLVLILHGDCLLKQGFIAQLTTLALAHPDVGMIACRAEGIDEHGIVNWISMRYPSFESPTWDDRPIWKSLHLMPSAIVVRRDVYARLGGFREDIANGQDWEMWGRIIRASGIVMTPDVLACYRQHGGSITGQTCRSGQNPQEFAKLHTLLAADRPGYPLSEMKRNLRGMAYEQARFFGRSGDREAAAANFRVWRQLTPLSQRLIAFAK